MCCYTYIYIYFLIIDTLSYFYTFFLYSLKRGYLSHFQDNLYYIWVADIKYESYPFIFTRLILNEDCVTKVGKFFMQECMTNDDDENGRS